MTIAFPGSRGSFDGSWLVVARVVTVMTMIGGAAGCAVDPVDDSVARSAVTDHAAASHGEVGSVYTAGRLDPDNPFVQSLGTNDRACVTCHQEAEGFGIAPAGLQARFDATYGMDPIFRLNDGATSPNADVSTVAARRVAYDMLLSKGLIRVGLPIPPGAEFTLTDVDDPYGFASASELSLFRRPLPSTNVRFLSAIMWDGREPSLAHQALDATLGHAQATTADPAQLDRIVQFETGVYTAQTRDDVAGELDCAGGLGGPAHLEQQAFFLGINDPIGMNPTGAPFDPDVFTLFDHYAAPPWPEYTLVSLQRHAIHRGQQIFNRRPITITGVAGVNDVLGVPELSGTCTTCHDTPNVGNHSVPLPLDLGISNAERRGVDMPLYTLTNNADGRVVQTTDPGRALVTGKWADIGKFKGPILRGLSARPPYFHNGFAADLDAVVEFYDTRFNIGLSAYEKADLVAFLEAL
jgi:cytochrome c peroxidase